MCAFLIVLTWRMFCFSDFNMVEEKKKSCSDAMKIICHKDQDGGNLLHFFQSSFSPRIFLFIFFPYEFVATYLFVSTGE